MNQDAIKIEVVEQNGNNTTLAVFESKNGGDNWIKCGILILDPDIACLFRDVMFRGRGRWDLTWEDLTRRDD